MSKMPPELAADLAILRTAYLALPAGREVMAEPCDAHNALCAIGRRDIADGLTRRPERGAMKWAMRPATMTKFAESVFAESFTRADGKYGAVYTRNAR